jgi:hypothetical protein
MCCLPDFGYVIPHRMGNTPMKAKMLARMSVWLVVLGVMTAGLTFCNQPMPDEVATVTPRVMSQATNTEMPTSTPAPATDTPTAAEPTTVVIEEVTETPIAEPTQTATEVPTVEPTEVATEEPTAEATPEATEEATVAAVVDVSTLSSDTCVTCHTSQETLQALAEDKKVASEASSGEG